ncbi:MAG: PKD domain-containing protein [Saprospiraceae bacterium]
MRKINIFWRVGIMTIFCLMINIGTVKATHIVGGDMTYRHISGDRYEITLSLRRDCLLGSDEAPFDPIAHVGVFSANGALLLSIGDNGLLKIPYIGNDTLNPFIRSDCGFEGTQVCVQEAKYVGILTLPFRNGGYILAYQRCCRNATVANIIDPLNTGATYWVAITQAALSLKNNSPAFTQWPDVYICANKPLVFDHSAKDLDGDSLVYKLCLPNKGASFDKPNPPLFNSSISPPPFPFVTWAPPYNLSNVMGGTPLQIDANTGLLTGQPNLVGQFLVGICVEEYRNGVLISEIKRDFQYNVRICSQPPKAFFDVPEVECNGLEVEFTNNSLAASNFRWYFDWPNQDPNFFSTEKNPKFTYPTSGIYNVKLRATRGSDGCFDSIIYAINVFENLIEPDFSFRLDECDLDNQTLTLMMNDLSTYPQPGYQIIDRIWTVIQNQDTVIYNGQNVQVLVDYQGEILVELEVVTDNGCHKVLERTIDPNVVIPKTDFSYELDNCPQNGIAQLRIKDLSVPLNPFGVIGTISWKVNNESYTGSDVLINLPVSTTNVVITQSVSFVSSCTIEKTKSFNLQTLLPKADYTYEALGCDDDATVNIKLEFNDHLALGYPLTNGQWTINVNGISQNFTGNEVELTIPKGKELSFEFIALFDNGCSDTLRKSFLPGPFATLVFNGNSHILCPNQKKALLLNGNSDWTYTWMPDTWLDLTDPTNPLAIGTEDIIYTVSVTDGLCSDTGTVVIAVLGTGIVLQVTGNENTCDGTVELQVTGGIGEGEYSWSTSPNMSNIISVGDTLKTQFTGNSKTYFVQFAGESCSTNPASFTVTNQTPFVLTPSPYRICPGDSVVISVFNENVDHVLTYEWEDHPYIRGEKDKNQITLKVDLSQVTPFSLFFTVTNQYGCSKRDSVLFLLDQNPVADFSFDLKECGDNTICFEYTGTHIGFFQWNFGDPTTNSDVSSERTPCYTYPESGIYTVTLTNLTSICPFKTVEKEVKLNDAIEINPIPTAFICQETTVSFEAETNISDVTYVWCTTNGVVISTEKTLNVTVQTDTSFIIKVKDIYGCEVSDTVEVKMFTFQYTLNLPEVTCRNESGIIEIDINNPEDYNYSWLPIDCIASGNNSITPSIIAVKDKVYSVIITHTATGCQDTKEFVLNVPDPLTGNLEGPNIFCYDQNGTISLTVEGTSTYQYTWSPLGNLVSGQNTKNPVFKFTDSEEVQVVVEDLTSHCKDTFYFTPDINPPVEIEVDAQPDITVYEGREIEIFVVDPDPNAMYSWSTGANGTIIKVSPTDNTSYIVTVTDSNGCTGTDVVDVEVRKAKCDETDIFIPNAFSPNGDVNNPVLYVRSNFIEELDFIIYNRWGQQIFKTNNVNAGWDGTFNGELLAPDAYAYYIKARCINGTIYQKAGNVTLLR